MKNLAADLSVVIDHYVLDKTDVEGRFNFEILFAPDDNTPGTRPESCEGELNRLLLANGITPQARVPREPVQGNGPTIFKALETLGLKLEPTKGPARTCNRQRAAAEAECPRLRRGSADRPAAAEASPSLKLRRTRRRARLTWIHRWRMDPQAGRPQCTRRRQVEADPPAQSEKLSVVSIKPCPDVASAQTGRGAGPNLAQTSPGHVYWACVTLAALVNQAYAGWIFRC